MPKKQKRRPSQLLNFTRPVCRTCKSEAIIVLESEGACGVAWCCPQGDHVEIKCITKECRQHEAVYDS